jgi:hypothetical protein
MPPPDIKSNPIDALPPDLRRRALLIKWGMVLVTMLVIAFPIVMIAIGEHISHEQPQLPPACPGAALEGTC